MAERTATKSRPANRPTGGRVQVAPIPMQPSGTAQGGGGQKLSDRIKEHPFASGSIMAVTVAAVYLIYQHFHSSSTAATPTGGAGATTGGTGGGRGHYLGGATGGGAGSGGGSSDSGSGVGSPAPTVDLTGLSSLLSGIQTELGMLGQEIAGIGASSSGGGTTGGGGTAKPLPYSALPGVQPVNTLPASAKTVNVPVGGATYAIPYTGDKPSPALVSQLGTTIAANAGIATNGISAGNIAAAKKAVAAGAGSQAPTGLGGVNPVPAAPKASASLPPKTSTAPAASKGSTASSQAALANQISKKVAAQPAPKPASTAPKTVKTTTGQTVAVNTARKTSIVPG